MDKKKYNLFTVILSYKVPLEKIDAFRPAHLDFLSHCYAKGLFIISGTQVPRSGGIIIAKCDNKDVLQKILAQDPFAINSLATYEIIEFSPTKWNNQLETIIFSKSEDLNKIYDDSQEVGVSGNVYTKQGITTTTIIYLTGKPGVGKYTIAKELAAKYGFIVCDNQLINNPIFELLQYDGYAKIPDFAWDAIARIRAEVFNFLAKSSQNSYVLTNCLADNDEDKQLYEQVQKMAEARGSLFVPVQIQISKEEHLKRLTRLERRERWKSIDPADAEDNGALISISHPNLFSLNVSKLRPEDAAEAIMKHINELKL